MAASGVVIVEAGRLGSPGLLAIADVTGGIVIRLSDGAGAYGRGTMLQVTGRLAAPYGQLEIRSARDQVRVLAAGIQPAPMTVPTTGLAEAMEGRLATTTVRLASKPRTTAGGDVTIVLERDGAGAVKVSADASSGVTARSLGVGASYRVVGFVDQRATRSGALDGYRLWIRDSADLVLVGSAASPNPSPSLTRPSATPAVTATVSIARALRMIDRTLAIDAVVTTPSALLDATGRRIVVQDQSGAIELLVPTSTSAPPVGTRIHAEGLIGVAYGAPRLRADRLDVSGHGSLPQPIALRAIPGPAHEWRLVQVIGRVTSIHKLGERWRAELLVGTQLVVIVGQPGAGIPSTTMVEGRTATVTGIARRPSPGASDHRFVITPRFAADVRVTGPTGTGPSHTPAGGGTGDQPAVRTPSPTTGGLGHAAGAEDADLLDLKTRTGTLVRVGGIVTDLQPDGFSLDDGTAIGRVVLRGSALERLALVEPDDALNVIGRVEPLAGALTVVVDDPGGLIQTGDPLAAEPSPTSSEPIPATSPADGSPPAIAAEPGSGSRFAGLGGVPSGGDTAAVGVGTLMGVSALSLAVTLLRRRHGRRRLTGRIAARLATFAGPSGLPGDPSAAERDPSTAHSA